MKTGGRRPDAGGKMLYVNVITRNEAIRKIMSNEQSGYTPRFLSPPNGGNKGGFI